MKSDYEIRANDFALRTGTRLRILDMEYKPMWDEEQYRYVFKCRLTRKRKSYTFEFGQSLYNGSKEPTYYDVLSCLEKYDVGTFEQFCHSYGYDTDSRKAERTWKAVVKEYRAVCRLFGDVMDELRAIE